jgi:hypothetical protein
MLIADANTQETVGHLVDLTPDGFMMDCPKSIPVERDFYLRLDVMPDVADKAFITFVARSKWCKPDAVEPYLFDVGFKIINISPHDADIIRRISDKYAAQDGYTYFQR